jgi:nucleotide-binding universal stress UspA family protein
MIAIEKEPKSRARGPRGNKTIVCVDDEPLVNRALYRLFSREPYDVLIADSARKALRYVQDYDVDLVITDQRMPDMSGVELLREVRQASPATNGIILTAYPESVLVDDPPEAPIPPLFAKPWDDDVLREGVRELLREAPVARPEVAVRTVLAPLDGSIEPEWTLGSVLPILKADPIRIVLLQVLPDLGLHRDVYVYLERTRARLAEEGLDVSADVRWGDAARQILLHARHASADVIVLTGSQKRGWRRRFRKTLVEKVLEEAEVPLLVGRPDIQKRSWQRITVPLDGTREAEAALPDAVRIAGKTGAWIDLVGVSPRYVPVADGIIPYIPRVPDRTPYLAEVARYIEMQDVPTEVRTFEGGPADEILRHVEASGSDLICMTARRRAGWARFFGGGSVAREILRRARCPILLRGS